jgi:hypothetical protein
VRAQSLPPNLERIKEYLWGAAQLAESRKWDLVQGSADAQGQRQAGWVERAQHSQPSPLYTLEEESEVYGEDEEYREEGMGDMTQ